MNMIDGSVDSRLIKMENRAVKLEKGVIEVKIQYAEAGSEQHKLKFETYRDVALRRIFLDFCNSLGLSYSTITFRFEGKLIKDTQSADEFGLEDGDLIDAFNIQQGGAAAANAFNHQITAAGTTFVFL